MELTDYIMPALVQLGASAPALLFWIAVIVFAAVRLGRGGGRAERFMIAGGVVAAAAALLRGPVAFVPLWLIEGGSSTVEAASTASIIGIIISIVGAAGIGLLIYAFWLKFHARQPAESTSIELERGPDDAVPR